MTTWFSLTLASIVFLSSYYFLSKRLFNEENEVDPRFYGAALQFTTGLIALPFALYFGFQFHFTLTSCLLLVAMAVTYTIGPSLYYTGLKKVELSETTILDSSGVLWSLILGILILGETLNIAKVAGVILIFVAILLIAGAKGLKIKSLSRYKFAIILSGLFYALGATLDNRLLDFSTAISYVSFSFIIAGVTMFLFNIHRLKSHGLPTLKSKNFPKTIFINAIFIFLTYFCIDLAFKTGGEVSKMYPIQQSESVIVPLIAIFILKERDNIPRKILAALIAFSGILLLK